MLDAKVMEIVKSTAPLIAETGPKLTAHFYDRMFTHNPELKNIFNMSNQSNGRQREALFQAVYGYAANIDNLAVLLPAVERIAQKHASFNIQPEQYDIVGKHLLATIDELFSPGEEVLDAWAQAYGVLANVFINREAEIYQDRKEMVGGWNGTRDFRVIKKEKMSDVITSFELEPVDGQPVVEQKPGQFLALYLKAPEWEFRQIRQYSISNAPNGKTYRISVKREDKGAVSSYLHNSVNVGDVVQVAPPFGEFFFKGKETDPVVLISAGVGQTPLLSMLQYLGKKKHAGEVLWVHAAESGSVHAFRDEILEQGKAFAGFKKFVWYNLPGSEDVKGTHYDYEGFADLSLIREDALKPNAQFYLCGPGPFMEHILKQLKELGVDSANVHYEHFGPHKDL